MGIVLAILAFTGCGDVDAGGVPEDAEAAVRAATAGGDATGDPGASSRDSDRGSVTFTVSAGGSKAFEFIDPDHSYHTRVASMLLARPEPGATEQLMIVFMGMDLKEITLPADLPPPPASPPVIPPRTVGVSYTNPSGMEWSGPARVRVEAMGSDGVLEGVILEAILPHTGGTAADLVLTEGRFRGRITDPF